jgi:hypothetical protein
MEEQVDKIEPTLGSLTNKVEEQTSVQNIDDAPMDTDIPPPPDPDESGVEVEQDYSDFKDCTLENKAKSEAAKSLKRHTREAMYTEYISKCEKEKVIKKRRAEFETVDNLIKNQSDRNNEYDDYLIEILLLTADRKLDDIYPGDGIYRLLIPMLIDKKIIKLDIKCDNIGKLLRRGKQLGKHSASVTLQYAAINIYKELLDVAIDFQQIQECFSRFIKRNPKILKYASSISSSNSSSSSSSSGSSSSSSSSSTKTCGDLIKDESVLNNLFNNKIIMSLQKVKTFIFMKLGLLTTESLTQFDDLQNREIYFYEYFSKFAFRNNLPNICTYFGSYECPREDIRKQAGTSSDQLFESLNKLETDAKGQMEESYSLGTGAEESTFVRLIRSYIMLITENMDNIITFSAHYKTYTAIEQRLKSLTTTQLSEKRAIDREIKEIDVTTSTILIQILYTLYVFEILNFVHNDLHAKNIMLEKTEKPITMHYIIPTSGSEFKVITIHSNYFVRIFDFDRSYMFGPNAVHTGPGNLEFTKWDSYENFSYQKNYKIDMFKVFLVLKTKRKFSRDSEEDIGIGNFLGNLADFKLSPLGALVDICKNQKNLAAGFFNNEYIKVSSLEETKIDSDSSIYFDPTQNINKLKNILTKNPFWKKLDLASKISVCHPLLNKAAYENIPEIFCKMLESSATDKIKEALTGGFYYDLYTKNKVIYKNLCV